MTTQTLNRADYCYSEASELLNLSTATIIDMVNNGTLEHTACGDQITTVFGCNGVYNHKWL